MEHRWGHRIAVDLPIRLASADASAWRTGRLTNVSITGALIRSDFAFRLLSLVSVVIESRTVKNPESKRIAGYVARIDHHGMGVEWAEMAAPAVVDLVRIFSGQRARSIETAELID